LEITTFLLPIIQEAGKLLGKDVHSLQNKILNFLLKDKYQYISIDNIYYLVRGLKNLETIPIFKLERNAIDFTTVKSLNVTILNGLGSNVEVKNTLKFSIDESSKDEHNEEESLDLKEENQPVKEISLKLSGKPRFGLNITNLITRPGKYELNIKYGQYTSKLPIQAYSKVKIDHIKFDVSGKDDTTIEYPKRSFKSVKVNHKDVLSVKIKVISSNLDYSSY
jgi:hypothetical protein